MKNAFHQPSSSAATTDAAGTKRDALESEVASLKSSVSRSSLVSNDNSAKSSVSADSLPNSADANNQGTPEKRRAGLVACRLCDDFVLAEEIENHSKSCAINQEKELKMYSCNARLEKLEGLVKAWLRLVSMSISSILLSGATCTNCEL